MGSETGLIAVDWGTTNRRAYRLGSDGAVLDRLVEPRGVTAVAPGGFPAEIAALRARFGEGPLLLAGMIGSNRGWIEVPYVSCSADLGGVVAGLVRPAAGVAIVPGVSLRVGQRCDVMRGEEVQLLGAAAAGLVPADSLCCHPGTHTKWARLERSALTDFRTVMTGELFALLRNHSILAPSLGGAVRPGTAFLEGVGRSLASPELGADLFGIRARLVLGAIDEHDAASLASGLLIGADIRTGLALGRSADPISVVGDDALTALYVAAIRHAGRTAIEVDGEDAFLAGIRAIARAMSQDGT